MNKPIIIYNTEDGRAAISLHLQNETVWLSLDQMEKKVTTEYQKFQAKTLSKPPKKQNKTG
ncbi:hypothetical protein [Paralysiella testudinis]|uniref:Virulence protein n=1 Tax=Paralysiella testudinis TaxID=2809020 RepID=A0A892ZFJ0_9NEIS|nr:hypothetical protein [Paralysiella testudinis]QRQ81403.1 hypothetical protein JQU52_11895 [Paralysiella testudinis]